MKITVGVTRPPFNHQEYAELIEKYKVQNPVKYALKKEALEAKLGSIGKVEKPKEPVKEIKEPVKNKIVETEKAK
jgi:hypothetical protein